MREAVLWGEHLDEYSRMFGLTETDLNARLLEYNCGATAVNAELRRENRSIISCDPLFSLGKSDFVNTVNKTFDQAVLDLRKASKQYDFSYYGGFDALIEKRRQGIETCLADYEQGVMEGRYLPSQEDVVPFENFSFDLAISTNYLFSSMEQHGTDFHLQCIRELTRVAKEVRIFSLIDREGQPSPLIGPVLLGLQQANYGVEVRTVDYQLQQGDQAMLRVWALECVV
jgi:hypothetical protein